jgi:hypothetical protein
LYAALGLLVVSNAFLLINAARNRAGEPEAEIELTERELRYYPHGNDDSSITLMLQWQNPVLEYRYPIRPGETGFFDRAKLEEVGFDLSVAPDAKQADRFYRAQRSREVYVALEYDGAAWQEWLKRREAFIATETQYAPQIDAEERMRIERESSSRLVAVDVSLDPARLREKFPDRTRVLILSGRARGVLDTGTTRVLRGAITTLSTETINVPHAFRPQLERQTFYSGWRTSPEGGVIIEPPAFAATIRVGSRYEPWVTSIRRLR